MFYYHLLCFGYNSFNKRNVNINQAGISFLVLYMGYEEVIPTLAEDNGGVLGVGESFVCILNALFNGKHAVPHRYLRVP